MVFVALAPWSFVSGPSSPPVASKVRSIPSSEVLSEAGKRRFWSEGGRGGSLLYNRGPKVQMSSGRTDVSD